MKMYSLEAVEGLIDRYLARGGFVDTIQEGCLGYGTTVLYGEGLKYAVIKEKYLNAWSSGHTIRFYNKLPNKFTN